MQIHLRSLPLQYLSILLSLTLLAGCASVGKLQTPSGKPEVTVQGVELQKLKDLCAASLMPDGYRVEVHSGYSLILRKRDEPTFFQAQGNIHEATFNFAEFNGAITIYHSMQTIENPGTAYPGVVNNNTQKELEIQQRRLEVIAEEARRSTPSKSPSPSRGS